MTKTVEKFQLLDYWRFITKNIHKYTFANTSMEHFLTTLIKVETGVSSNIVDERIVLCVLVIDCHIVVKTTFKYVQLMTKKLLSYNSLIKGH